MECRFCKEKLNKVFLDLVNSPASNSFLTFEQLNEQEVYFPLKVLVCEDCFLVQIDEHKKSDEIFNSNYAYFSSFSKSWLEHCKKYCNKMIREFKLNKDSLVIEVASNDGYLLQYFKEKEINVLGIEPTINTANVAIQKGIKTIKRFFGETLAQEISINQKADLIIANNVLAHVPDINDFVKGFKILLNKEGLITFEFPHLMQLIENNQFDTIYHEHYSYLSFLTVKKIFEKHQLEIFDVEEIKTHGGSLRVYVKNLEDNTKKIKKSVTELLDKELKLEMILIFKKKLIR
jgi:2-polyprenyl-3-methyl-5-hydroxy-6-metoxy-1,4-benzoquinol methylase